MHDTRNNKARIALVACAILSFATSNLASAAVVSGSCAVPTGLAFKTSTAQQLITSSSFIDLPSTQISFVQGGSVASCVILSFTASVGSGPSSPLMVRALLDDSIVCDPKGDNFFAAGPELREQAMNFICPNVVPGSHSIKIQFRIPFDESGIIDNRSTIVHFRK